MLWKLFICSQLNATLAPRLSHELVWNRTCNPRGGPGNNVELDLNLEHLNRIFKDDLNTFKANITEHSIDRSSHAIGPIGNVLDNFDRQMQVKRPGGQ